MNVLKKTLTLSTLLHLFVLGQIFFKQNLFFAQNEPYFIDFISTPSDRANATSVSVGSSPRKIAAETIQQVHPKEDLVIKKTEKKISKKKEAILAIPQTPPVPKILTPSKTQDSSVLPIPGTGSENSSYEIGIGFGSGEGGSFTGTTEFQYGWYLQGMKKKLDSHWISPSQHDSGLQTQVEFLISKEGAIQKIKIEKSSGNDLFDQAALRAVKEANPFPPLPAQYAEKELRAHVRFITGARH